MDPLRVTAEANGFFTRAEALAVGHDDLSIRRALKLRLWRRLRNGAYTFSDLWPDEAEAQHAMVAHAVLSKLGDKVALSHASAAVEHGLRLWQPDLSRVHVTRTDAGAGRTEAGVVHHEGLVVDNDLVRVDGRLVTSPARAALESASQGSVEAALVTLDSLLHLRLATREELDACYAAMQSWPRFRALRIAVLMADRGGHSVGESRGRYLFYRCGLPAPELQFEVRDSSGHIVGWTDFAWPAHGLLGEFDGKVKYLRLLREGETPSDAVVREKQRENLLCELTGWRMIRFVWADLYDAPRTAARVQRMLRRAA